MLRRKLLSKSVRFLTATRNRNMHYRTVVVEGNIASGKSTFLEYFRKFPNAKIFQEPVQQWQDMKGYNLLELLYKDTKRWSFAFQTYADFTRLRLHHSTDQLKDGDTKLMERSLYSGRYCFAENNFRSGQIDPVEFTVLDEYFRWMIEGLSDFLKVDLIVYLRTDPETSYQRLLKRRREEEKTVPLAYIQSLHTLYDEWLIEKRHPVPSDVIVVDANVDLPSICDTYKDLSKKILFPSSCDVNNLTGQSECRILPNSG